MRFRPPRRHGFTVVELLVVVFVLAVLIGLLLPSLSRARRQALALVCASNLRQMGQGLFLYVDQTGYYPGSQLIRGGTGFGVWPARLRWALGGRPGDGHNIFWCPAQEEGFRWQSVYGTGPLYATPTDTGYGYEPGELLLNVFAVPFSYGYNDWGGSRWQSPDTPVEHQYGLGGDLTDGHGAAREVRASRVRMAAEMIAIADNTADGVWDYNVEPFNKHEYPGKVHNGGANVLFCDGHVQWYPQKDLVEFANPDPMARLWNSDHKIRLKDGTTMD